MILVTKHTYGVVSLALCDELRRTKERVYCTPVCMNCENYSSPLSWGGTKAGQYCDKTQIIKEDAVLEDFNIAANAIALTNNIVKELETDIRNTKFNLNLFLQGMKNND